MEYTHFEGMASVCSFDLYDCAVYLKYSFDFCL